MLAIAYLGDSLHTYVRLVKETTADEAPRFDARPGVYGLFPTFGSDNVTRYRPTNEDCLMRLVTAPGFCNVCLESLWLTLLARVDLIDGVDEVERTTTVHNQQTEAKHGQNTLSVRLISLGQLRGVDIGVKERYSVVWSKDGVAVDELSDKLTVSVGEDETWTVSAKGAGVKVF